MHTVVRVHAGGAAWGESLPDELVNRPGHGQRNKKKEKERQTRARVEGSKAQQQKCWSAKGQIPNAQRRKHNAEQDVTKHRLGQRPLRIIDLDNRNKRRRKRGQNNYKTSRRRRRPNNNKVYKKNNLVLKRASSKQNMKEEKKRKKKRKNPIHTSARPHAASCATLITGHRVLFIIGLYAPPASAPNEPRARWDR